MAQKESRKTHTAANRNKRRARRAFWRRVRRLGILFVVSILGLIIILGLVLPGVLPGPTHTFERGGEGPGTLLVNQGRNHFEPGETAQVGYYNSTPPTSGTHSPSWERCGVFEVPIPDELQVHNLEHGFVLIQYDTEDESVISSLERVVGTLTGYPDYLILAPYEGMGSPITLTAWNVIQHLDTVDEDKIRAFDRAYRGRGPEVGVPGCLTPGLMDQS